MPATDTTTAGPEDRQGPQDALGEALEAMGLPNEPEDDTAAEQDETTDANEDAGAEVDDRGGEEGDEQQPPSDTERESSSDSQEPDGLPARAIAAAKNLGYTDEELAEMGPDDEDMLLRAEQKLTKKMSEIGRKQQKMHKGQDDGQQNPGDEGGDQGTADDEWSELEFQFDDLEDLDNGTHDVKLNALLRTVKELKADLAARRSEQQWADIDKALSDAKDHNGKPLFPEYGEGDTVRLGTKSEERAKRQALLEEAQAIQQGYKVMGRSLPTAEAIDLALRAAGKDRFEKAAAGRQRKAMQRRRNQAVPRGSGHSSTRERGTPDRKLNQALDEFEREHGIKIPE